MKLSGLEVRTKGAKVYRTAGWLTSPPVVLTPPAAERDDSRPRDAII
jgi:hypothetical protein